LPWRGDSARTASTAARQRSREGIDAAAALDARGAPVAAGTEGPVAAADGAGPLGAFSVGRTPAPELVEAARASMSEGGRCGSFAAALAGVPFGGVGGGGPSPTVAALEARCGCEVALRTPAAPMACAPAGEGTSGKHSPDAHPSALPSGAKRRSSSAPSGLAGSERLTRRTSGSGAAAVDCGAVVVARAEAAEAERCGAVSDGPGAAAAVDCSAEAVGFDAPADCCGAVPERCDAGAEGSSAAAEACAVVARGGCPCAIGCDAVAERGDGVSAGGRGAGEGCGTAAESGLAVAEVPAGVGGETNSAARAGSGAKGSRSGATPRRSGARRLS
jgi:hypothetical protein